MEKIDNTRIQQHDYLILGGGPGGLQIGYYLEKADRDYLILEAEPSVGAFFRKFPRHRTLISINKVFTGFEDSEKNLRWDWNSLLCDDDELLFKHQSKKYFPDANDLVQYLNCFAKHYNLKIQYSTRITQIKKEGSFILTDSNGNVYSAKRLIVATGFTKPYIPPIPGVELVENYFDVSTNPEDFTNQSVLIIGKGNSGFETADNLIESTALIHIASPSSLNMAWKSHFVGHLRAVNNNLLDTYQLKSQNAVLDATIEKIERKDGKFVVSFSYTHAKGESEDLVYDRVILCAGFQFDASIFDQPCRPALTIKDRFPSQTTEWESSNIKDLYFAGTLTQARDYRKTTSGFIHGFRYNIRSLHRMLEQKYHAQQWPRMSLSVTPESFTNKVIDRVNLSSALWQQFGYLCDYIMVGDTGQKAQYFEEVPVDYIHDGHFGSNIHYYVVTLEFGKAVNDPFNIERNPDPSEAQRSTFLHPIVRRYDGSSLISEHHILEDLYGDWRKPEAHVQPLLDYFSFELNRMTQSAEKS